MHGLTMNGPAPRFVGKRTYVTRLAHFAARRGEIVGPRRCEERAVCPTSSAAAVASPVAHRPLAGLPPPSKTEAAAALLRGLVESGIAMALAGSSRPASGCEHHASHFWDLLAARGRRSCAPHGVRVGYATRFAFRLQRFAFGGGLRALRRPVSARDPLGAEAREWFGEPTKEIVAAVEEKHRFAAAWTDPDWEAVQAPIADSLELFEAVDGALEAAGIPYGPGFLGLDERTRRATFRYATRLRARYTTVDFLEGQGALDEALDLILGPSPRDGWGR